MVTIEATAGQQVLIGPHILRVLAVQRGRVVVAVLDPRNDCRRCGKALVDGRCPACPPGPDQPPPRKG